MTIMVSKLTGGHLMEEEEMDTRQSLDVHD